MPTVAGILDFISGGFQLLAAIFVLFAVVFGKHAGIAWGFAQLFLKFTIPLALPALLAIVGGFYNVQRNKWRLAMAGSIAAFFPLVLWLWFVALWFGPMWALIALAGIAAIVLTVLSKKEFE